MSNWRARPPWPYTTVRLPEPPITTQERRGRHVGPLFVMGTVGHSNSDIAQCLQWVESGQALHAAPIVRRCAVKLFQLHGYAVASLYYPVFSRREFAIKTAAK